jgi:hypothetical protein
MQKPLTPLGWRKFAKIKLKLANGKSNGCNKLKLASGP